MSRAPYCSINTDAATHCFDHDAQGHAQKLLRFELFRIISKQAKSTYIQIGVSYRECWAVAFWS